MMLYSMTDDGIQTQGTPSLNEDILCTYIDLDRLIQECGMSESQEWIVRELMKGYSLTDIAEQTDKRRSQVGAELADAVKKIQQQNNENWRKTKIGLLNTKQ